MAVDQRRRLEDAGDPCGVGIGRLGEGAAIATAMIPFLLAAITISWFGMQRRKWQQGSDK